MSAGDVTIDVPPGSVGPTGLVILDAAGTPRLDAGAPSAGTIFTVTLTRRLDGARIPAGHLTRGPAGHITRGRAGHVTASAPGRIL